MKPGFERTLAILVAIALGALVPSAHVFAGVIRWLVMAMLFLVFLQTRLSRGIWYPSQIWLVIANLGMGFAAYGIGWAVGGRDLALAGFFAGITPTATAAPVIVSFLRGRVEYVIGAFLLTNVVIAALLPVILPVVLGRATPQLFAEVTGSVAGVVFLPMAAAWAVRLVHAGAVTWPHKLRNVSFGMWVAAMFLITANGSDFLRRQHDAAGWTVGRIALTTLLVCAANFALGRLIGGREFRREASQSLGQKNTTFTIYLALTYASPLVALGPTCYVLWHNLWNSWQLHLAARRAAGPNKGIPPDANHRQNR